MSLKEQVAYLKGLAEGLDVSTETKEGKLINAIIDTLSAMAEEIEDLIENALDIGDELDAISDDLADVEGFVFDDDDDDDDFFDYDDDDDDDYDDDDYDYDCEEGCQCAFCGGTDFTVDIVCPACGAEIEIDESSLNEDSINCPECDELLEFEYDDDDDEDDEDLPFDEDEEDDEEAAPAE